MPSPHDDTSTPPSQIAAQQYADAVFAQEANALRDRERAACIARFVRSALVVVAVLVLAAVCWKLGLLSRGFDKRRVVWNSPVSLSHRGLSLGCKTFYATAGQTVNVQYNAAVRRGYFQVWIRRKNFVTLGPVEAKTGFLKSGTGTLQWVVPQSGVYKVFIFASPDGNGYDVSYDVNWRVQ